jgi:hypothetical protein
MKALLIYPVFPPTFQSFNTSSMRWASAPVETHAGPVVLALRETEWVFLKNTSGFLEMLRFT